MLSVPSLTALLKPPSPLAGRLSVQSVLYAVGDGTFMTASAVFFTQIVGLSVAQVGLGITVAGVVSFLVAVPAGKLADRIGPQRMWGLGAAGTAAMYTLWPFIDGFAAFLAMSVVLEVVNSAGGAGRGAYVIDVLPQQERVQSQAYMYSALNLGFTLGAALGGIALAFNSDQLIRALPLLTAALVVLNAIWISGCRSDPPRAAQPPRGGRRRRHRRGARRPAQRRVPRHLVLQRRHPHQPGAAPDRDPALADRGDRRAAGAARAALRHQHRDVHLPADGRRARCPRRAHRAAGDPGQHRVLRVSCLVTLVTHDTVGWVTIALVWLGHITVTGAELYFAAANWSFEAELSDPDRRGEYQGAGNLGGTLGYVFAPAVYTFLVMSWGAAGWLVIAAIVVVATIGIHPSSRAAQRFLDRHQLDPHR